MKIIVTPQSEVQEDQGRSYMVYYYVKVLTINNHIVEQDLFLCYVL